MTKILSEKNLDCAAEILCNGGICAFPTETVYGLGVVFDNLQAYESLVKVKKRSPDKPFSLMCSSLEMVKEVVDCSSKVLSLMEEFLPGEITFLVKGKESLPHWNTLGTGIVGIRVPDSSLALNLLKKVNKPCLVTSANISGEPTLTTFKDVNSTFNGLVEGIVKGECKSNIPSTIVDLSNEREIKLVREGSLPFDKVLESWRKRL